MHCGHLALACSQALDRMSHACTQHHMSAALTSTVGHPRPVTAWQALHRPLPEEPEASITGQFTACPQAAAVIPSPGGVADCLSVVDA